MFRILLVDVVVYKYEKEGSKMTLVALRKARSVKGHPLMAITCRYRASSSKYFRLVFESKVQVFTVGKIRPAAAKRNWIPTIWRESKKGERYHNVSGHFLASHSSISWTYSYLFCYHRATKPEYYWLPAFESARWPTHFPFAVPSCHFVILTDLRKHPQWNLHISLHKHLLFHEEFT